MRYRSNAICWLVLIISLFFFYGCTMSPIPQSLSLACFTDEVMVLGSDTLRAVQSTKYDGIWLRDSSLELARGEISFAVSCIPSLNDTCAGTKNNGLVLSGGLGNAAFKSCSISVAGIEFRSDSCQPMESPCPGATLIDSTGFVFACNWAPDSSYESTVYVRTFWTECVD